jgi:hypothetical protein
MILTPIAEQLLVRAQQVAEQFAPLRGTLSALFESIPAGHEAALAHVHGRQPLEATKKCVADFFQSTRASRCSSTDPWLIARARLKQDPHAALPELTALLG